MIISEKHNFVFIGTPKCATNTMYEVIEKLYGGVRHGPFHCNRIPDPHKRKFVWTIIRNPYPRAVSIWWSAVVRPEENEDPYGAKKALGSLKFKDFCEWLVNGKHSHPLFMSQTQWIETINANIVPIIRLERINSDFWKLPFNTNDPKGSITATDLLHASYRLRGGLPIRNSSRDNPPNQGYGDWWRYYIASPMASLRVLRWAREDFERFGYETCEDL